MTETYRIGSAELSAEVSALGAELVSLKDAKGEELLWQAGAAWPRHAPVLFPIVGKLAGDALRHRGVVHNVTQHGFARDCAFRLEAQDERSVVLVLTDSEETRARYPFAFRLEMRFEVDGPTLTVASRVSNPGEDPLPFSIGAHPGFVWPLVEGLAKEAHVIEFETPESGARLTVEGGLLAHEAPLPFDGRTLPLSPRLFERDALVMPDLASRSVRYAAKTEDGEIARALTVKWRGYSDLGVWSAPKGAPFLCIEPWRGMASRVGWDGEFSDKPGVVILAPGEAEEFAWSVTV